MKIKIWILNIILLSLFYRTYSQQYLGDHHIVHKYNKFRSEEKFKWKKEMKKTNSFYRNLEFDIMFAENCEYVLPDYWQYQQNYKQKVVTLCTSQNFDSKNSLRIGWCWDIETSKIQLAFYAHINHLDPEYGGVKGREHIILQESINTGQWVHVKMAIGKKGMFMSINGKSSIVSRDIYSWSPNGEKTYVRAFSFFEFGEGNVKEGALHDMDFYIKNAYIDNPDFSWEKTLCEYTAEDISFMNTNFAYTDQGPYQFFAGNSIYCSKKSNSTVETELPYEPAFTVVEPGMDVGFTAGNSIKLVKGFHAKAGSHFTARIQDVQEPVYPVVTNGPDVLTPTICYTVKNTDGFNFYLYADPEHQKWITGGTGYVVGKNACYEIPGYNEIPNGKYYAVSVFDNTCKLITEEDILFKEGKALLQSDIIVQNHVHKASVVHGNENGQIKTGVVDSMEIGLPPKLSIFPNPSPGLFTLRFDDGESSGFAVEITNMMGNVVYKRENVQMGNAAVDIREQPKGVYFVKVQAGGKVYIEKVVVE